MLQVLGGRLHENDGLPGRNEVQWLLAEAFPLGEKSQGIRADALM